MRMYIRMRVCIYKCAYVYVMCVYVFMFVCMYVCIYVYMYMYVYVCICIYTYMCVYVCACRSICPRLPEGAIFELCRESRSDLADLDGLENRPASARVPS